MGENCLLSSSLDAGVNGRPSSCCCCWSGSCGDCGLCAISVCECCAESSASIIRSNAWAFGMIWILGAVGCGVGVLSSSEAASSMLVKL